MKEEAIKPDRKRGIDLLSRVLRLYPFSNEISESFLNNYRDQKILRVWNRLWVSYILDLLDMEGYSIDFEFPYHPTYRKYNLNDYYKDINVIVIKIIDYFHKIEKKPKKDIYLKNREFICLRKFFKLLYFFLELKDEHGGWKKLLKTGDNETIEDFYSIFGFFHEKITKYITTPEEFCAIINEILKELGYEAFSLSNDGILRYFGITAEAQEKKRAYNLLSVRKYKNVIENLDKIYEHLSTNNYSDALANCRKALESFYKRFLINHGINILHDGSTNTEDGTMVKLAETVKRNISTLFNFPSYSVNLDTHGYRHLIESSKYIISGLANPAASHGKSSPPQIQLDEVKVAESFIILIINTFLPFEK